MQIVGIKFVVGLQLADYFVVRLCIVELCSSYLRKMIMVGSIFCKLLLRIMADPTIIPIQLTSLLLPLNSS